ncbi:MAG: PKD domain-containing protein [Bacteroidetes bacterium]|nr:PKD domain-containing protein [Bacteroidota bacterium]
MKENFTRIFLFSFFLLTCSVGIKNAHASHSMGADLTYRCLGGNSYEVSLSFYRDCVGIQADPFADIIYSSSCYGSFNATLYPIAGTGQEISPICSSDTTTCSGGSFTGIQEYVYTGIITLPGPCADWNFSYNLCCRNLAITNINNPGSTLMYIFATLDNTIAPCNNSPVFSNKPVPFACLGQQYCFNHGGFDPDGDSLVYSMMTPYDMAGLPIVYTAPFSPTQPLSSSPAVSFNSQTGDICMTPTNLEVTVMAVLVQEYRNGILIGSVERDIQLTVINCNNVLPTLSGMNGTNNFSQTVCAGAPTCFTINSADVDASQNLTVTWDSSIPGATFTTTTGPRPTATFCWTPGVAQVSATPYCFTANVTDDNCPYNGSQVYSYCITVTQATVNAGPDQVVCAGTSATLTASGASTYVWNPGGTTQAQLNVTPAGSATYTVTGTNASGCTATDQATVTVNPLPVADAGIPQAICIGESATFTASGGLTYLWNPGGTTSAQLTITPAATNSYTVTVTDANGCTSTDQTTLTVNPLPIADAGLPQAICTGNIATLTASGGVSYVWNPGGATTAQISVAPLVLETYTVTVTDANGCTSTDQMSVSVNPLPVADAGLPQTICFGASVTLDASGGLSYLWNPGGSTNAQLTISPSVSTDYTVTVTDANGCTSTDVETVSVNPLPITDAGIPQAICIGDSATFTATGGIFYLWNPGGSTADSITVNPNVTSTYTVTATDANGCTNTDQVTLTVNPLPLADAGADVNICLGDQIVLNASGGTTYVWEPGTVAGAQLSVSPLVNSSYTVTVTDANSCVSTDSVEVFVNPLPTAQVFPSSVSCNGGSNGFATVVPANGTSPFSYTWSPSGGSGVTATGLAAGTYTVTVTDDAGCTVSISTIVNEPTAVRVSSSMIPALCNGSTDGIAMAQANGGTPGYSYSWFPGGAVVDTVQGLAAGNYTVTVRDALGCTETSSVSVTEPTALNLNLVTSPALCNGGNSGSVAVGVSGGTAAYSYAWTPLGGTASSMTAIPSANYTVVVTDAHSCTASNTAMVSQPTALVLATNSVAATCGVSDGSATVNVQGGTPAYLYSWNPAGGNGATTVGLPTGIYTVRVTDGNGCTKTAQANIPSRAGPSISANVDQNVLCNGGNQGEATVTVLSGIAPYQIHWSPSGGNAAVASNLSSGSYTVVVVDVNGCSAMDTLTIVQPEAIVTVLSATPALCNGSSDGTAQALATGGVPPYQYLWSPTGSSSATISGLSANTYTLTVTDENGCQHTDRAIVSQPPAIHTVTNSLPAMCNGTPTGSVSVLAQGGSPGYNYHWTPGGVNAALVSGLFSGTYYVTVRDTNGCVKIDSSEVLQPEPLELATITTPVSCFGAASGTAQVDVNGGTPAYSYLWSPGAETSSQLSNLNVGLYEVTVTDHNACVSTASVNIVQAAPLAIQGNVPDTICIGQSALLEVNVSGGTSPYSYLWSTGDTTVSTQASPLTTSTYTVSVSDAFNCPTEPQVIILPVFPPLQVQATGDIEMCAGNSAPINANAAGGNGGPYSYSWNDSLISSASATVSPSHDSSFVVTVTDGCSPPVHDQVDMIIHPLPEVQFLPHTIEGCTPVLVDFQNYSSTPQGSSFTWNLGDQTMSNDSAPVHIYDQPGTYDVGLTIVSPEGCRSDLFVNDVVTVYGYPLADFSPSTSEVSIFNPVINFTDLSLDAITWNWDFGDGGVDSINSNPAHAYGDSGTYTIRLIVTSNGACPDTTYRQIHVEDVFTIYIPNAFTPNNNGVNDGFVAKGHGILKYEMWIIDRWGLEIFHSTDIEQEWDGTYYGNHSLCQNDVYEYVIDVIDFLEKKHRFIGHVTLVR